MNLTFGLLGLMLPLSGIGCDSGASAGSSRWDASTPLNTGGATVIDAAAGPDAGTTVARPVMNCGGDVGIIEITLPCQVGIAPLFAGECQLNAPARGKWAFITRLETMAENLNQRVDVGTVARGIVDVVPTFTSAGSSYRLTAVQGDAAIFQVDVTQRSFLGRLGHVDFVWTSDAGQEISCPLESGLFWAVPGEFL